MFKGDNLKKVRFNIKDLEKCGAKSKRTGKACQAPAMKNGRCRLHGGKSTGAKTKKGLKKLEMVNLKHGKYTKKRIEYRRYTSWFLRNFKGLMRRAIEEDGI